MQLVTRKVGPVTFEHREDFSGDVKIRKGDAEVVVSLDSLRAVVAESVRYELAAHVAKMKPADLLRRIA